MSRDDVKRRIPTSAQIEAAAVASPASGGSDGGLSRGLLKFFRVGRFRVADDVGIRKHVAEAPRQPAARQPAPSAPRADLSPPSAAAPLAPRPIRISRTVRERRGAGHDED